MPSPVASWQLADLIASHSRGGASVRLDLDAAALGLAVTSAEGRVDHLLGLDLAPLASGHATAPPRADHWLRGADLTAVYEPVDPRRLRATVMWRPYEATGPATAWEAVVSAQTALVESDGTIAVGCDVTATELLWSSAGPRDMRWRPFSAGAVLPGEATCILARRPDGAATTSVLVAVHPVDARRITTRGVDGRVRITCQLFSAALEKGVLLRSRVLAAIGPAARDTVWAESLVAAFAASPPPLTT
jgi:hypothetical protein